jgi:hypothetical protein
MTRTSLIALTISWIATAQPRIEEMLPADISDTAVYPLGSRYAHMPRGLFGPAVDSSGADCSEDNSTALKPYLHPLKRAGAAKIDLHIRSLTLFDHRSAQSSYALGMPGKLQMQGFGELRFTERRDDQQAYQDHASESSQNLHPDEAAVCMLSNESDSNIIGESFMANKDSDHTTPVSSSGDPHLSEASIREKYWHAPKGRALIDDSASRTIIYAAETATLNGFSDADKREAKDAVDRLVHDFPEAARKAVTRIRAPGNDQTLHGGSIKLIMKDLKMSEVSAPGTTPSNASASKTLER